MRKITLTDLQSGMVTAEPIFSRGGRQVLIQAGSRLNEQIILQIQKWDLPYIMIVDENEADLLAPPPENDPVLAVLPETMAKKVINFANNLEETLYDTADFFETVRTTGNFDMKLCSEIGSKIARNLVQPSEAINSLLFRISAKDHDYLERHSVSVAALAGMLATWMELAPAEIEAIVLGGFLHDIGKVRMPRSLITDNDPTPQRQELLRQHVFLAHKLLKDVADFPAAVFAAVTQHHEYLDGSGYPAAVSGDNIHRHARVVTVANRLCHFAEGVSGLNPFKMIETVKGEMFTMLDPAVCDTFVRRISDYLMNNPVKLDDGRKARVVYLPMINPTSPVLKTEDGQFVDLTKNKDITIIGLTF